MEATTTKPKAVRHEAQPVSGAWLVVMSSAGAERKCTGCGNVPVIFSCHLVQEGSVRDRCKECVQAMAAEKGLELHLVTAPQLRKVWSQNRRQDANPRTLEVFARYPVQEGRGTRG